MMRKPKVLVVDDDEGIRDILNVILSSHGFEVHMAETSVEFQQQAFNIKPDAIILDIVLGSDNGTEVYETLLARGLDRSIPVIFLTGLAGDRPREAPYPGRRFLLMSKPFSCDEITHDLEILLQNK